MGNLYILVLCFPPVTVNPSRAVPLAVKQLSRCYLRLGDVDTAKRLGEEALAMLSSSEHRHLPAVALCWLNVLSCDVDLFGSLVCLSIGMGHLADCYIDSGEVDKAIHLNVRSIEILQSNMAGSSVSLSIGECHCHSVTQLLVSPTKEVIHTYRKGPAPIGEVGLSRSQHFPLCLITRWIAEVREN